MKNVFSQFELSYVIRTYLIGIILTYFFLAHVMVDELTIGTQIFFIVSCILFPLATIVYDELISLLFGGGTYVIPIIFIIPYKLMKWLLLYLFTVLVAPIGFLYLTIRYYILQRS